MPQKVTITERRLTRISRGEKWKGRYHDGKSMMGWPPELPGILDRQLLMLTSCFPLAYSRQKKAWNLAGLSPTARLLKIPQINRKAALMNYDIFLQDS